ncbi:MAG TPA: UvrB/UvrC motif-containing protein, partial [Syntrophales bacterium]|nr:UvrB/UvrC motif-containing protein [Syntrophales bacterium]
LIQTIGRAARNVNGQVILYADTLTRSIQACVEETRRRREIQETYNDRHGITPTTIRKSLDNILSSIYESDYVTVPAAVAEDRESFRSVREIRGVISQLTKEMKGAAKNLEFERAAVLRDRIRELSKFEMEWQSWNADGTP